LCIRDFPHILNSMNPEQSSISIINRSGGTVTGQNTGALPIKLVTNISWLKFFLAGFVSAILLIFILVFTIKRQVVVVEVAGKSVDYQEYKLE
jgi:hypothetical protein